MTADRLDRFRKHLRPVGKGGCRIYGRNGITGVSLDGHSYTPRVAHWILVKGRRPAGKLVSVCGTPLCCNIGHLRDVNAERGHGNDGCRPRLRSKHGIDSHTHVLPLSIYDERGRHHNPFLTSPTCPVCGAPAYYTTCLVCGVPDAA